MWILQALRGGVPVKKAEMTVDYSPLSWFAKYLEILYAKDDLWEEFQHYVREIEPNRDADFFAYQNTGFFRFLKLL